jgi:hypothetical protein
MPAILANVVFFKAVWALSLYGVIIDIAWLGCAALLIFMAWHVVTMDSLGADFAAGIVAVIVGMTLDTLYLRAGLIEYGGQFPWTNFAPLWIAALWFNVALTLNHCMKWMQSRLKLAAFFGLICGPGSYAGAIALGAAEVTGNPLVLYSSIGIAWSLTVPFLLLLTRRFHEFAERDAVPVPVGA